MGTTSAHSKSSGNEPLSRQPLKFLARNSAKNLPSSLITLVGMLSDFEAFFEFNFLIIEVTLSVLTFWKAKFYLKMSFWEYSFIMN